MPNNTLKTNSRSIRCQARTKTGKQCKKRDRDFAGFEWQGGYADFSVSQSNLESVKQYIAGQEEHHRKMNFQDELRALLKRHEIEWDEKYVWD
jgi:hypothetical protein